MSKVPKGALLFFFAMTIYHIKKKNSTANIRYHTIIYKNLLRVYWYLSLLYGSIDGKSSSINNSVKLYIVAKENNYTKYC